MRSEGKPSSFKAQLVRVTTGLRRLPLKRQLGIVFTFVGILSTAAAGSIIYLQYKHTVDGGGRVFKEHTEAETAAEFSRILADIEVSRRELKGSNSKVLKLKNLLDRLSQSDESEAGKEILSLIGQRFQTYLASIDAEVSSGASGSTDVQDNGRYQELLVAIEAYRDLKRVNIYRTTATLRMEQVGIVQLSIVLLFVFLSALALSSFKIIHSVTSPLAKLAGTIDQIEVGGNHPPKLPVNGWKFREVARVADSFRQLLQRLHDYQSLNVGRLIAEKRRADIIAASISDGIFLLRGDEVIYANPVGEKILDLPQGASAKGLNVVEIVRGLNSREDREQHRGLLAVHSAMTRTMPVEFELKSHDRDLFYILQSIPIPAELVESIDHSFEGPADGLMERWQATTLVLARDETLMRESQEAKSHFIGTLSHEIKTPVTSLTMATRLLRKSVDQFSNQTHRALIETCAEDVDRLRGLLEDLLSVSRFDTLTQKLDLKSVDLGKLLRQTVQHFQPMAFERGVEITLRTESRKRVPVTMDAAKVSWALSNLMTNALRHTPRGGKVEAMITVDQDFAEIRIRDHGPGIEKKRQDRIFDKFNPFYDLRVARSGSVGMGLAIAREIIVAHGGKIWVVSEPGRGAEFCFTLPLGRSIAADGKSGSSASSNDGSGTVFSASKSSTASNDNTTIRPIGIGGLSLNIGSHDQKGEQSGTCARC